MSPILSTVRLYVCLLAGCLACVVGLPADASAQTATSGTLLISEFRVRGPNGANDEFVEIYNNTDAAHIVTAASGTGYGLAASNGVTRCSIPNGTVIPARGHYLCINSVGYSLASYPAGNGTTATGNATYTTDIPDNAGIALFNNNTGGGSYVLANRIDAVGSTSEANTLYKEGTGYPALTPFSIDYSFTRRPAGGCTGSSASSGNCTSTSLMLSTAGPTSSILVDTNSNAADFMFVDTNGTSAGAGQRLGAPGPENLSSPIALDGVTLTGSNLDPCSHRYEPPNQVRDFTSDPANNSTFGTLDLRRRFTNSTGTPITRLRFRIVDISTFPSISGVADFRPRTSTAVVVTVDRPPCGSGTSNVTVQGTTLEQPPSQPNGSGYNGSLSVGTITAAAPLAAGASVDVRFLIGIQQTGAGRFCVAAETIPASGSEIMCAISGTDGTLTFSNTTTITVPSSGAASPYPSNITVGGLRGAVSKVTVTLRSITHTFPGDMDVLLVGPTGVKLILMSDTLSTNDLSAATFTFDSAAASLLPESAAAGSGTYRPTNYGAGDAFVAPAPGGPYLNPAPIGADTLAAFNGVNPNGTWSLYVVDDVGGDTGTIGGWDLSITSSPLSGVVTSDFDGDAVSDIAVYRPSTGRWFVRNQNSVVWGTAGDIPVAGDYNGDGVNDRAVYRPSTGVWYVENQGAVLWGAAGDIPVPGDYFGAGTTQRAVYRPSTGTWYVEGKAPVAWGQPGDIPVPGDYNGDLVTDIAVYRVATGTWYVQGIAPLTWGAAGDVPVPGDYDGSGTTDFAVYRPSSGTWFIYGLAASVWGAGGDVPVPGDYNGDRRTDVAVYRPSTGIWYIQDQGSVAWGAPGDLPVPRPETLGDLNWDGTPDVGGYLADFDGNGTTDFAVYRPTTGAWLASGQAAVVWGEPGDIPVPGDYNGTNADEHAVYRPSTGIWFIEGQAAVGWGAAGDLPVPADYDGNGKVDIAVYRPSTAQWFVAGLAAVTFGSAGDVPMPGDYDGNGTAEIAIYRPSTGEWFIRNAATVQWGAVGDIPVPADYDGNGTVDIAIFRPSTAQWFIRNVGTFSWGGVGDVPVPGDFDGNGTIDAAVYRPSTAQWFVRNGATVAWGAAGDAPASRAYVPR